MKSHNEVPSPVPPWMTGPEPDNPYRHLLDELPDDEVDDPEEIKLGLAIPRGWSTERSRAQSRKNRQRKRQPG